MTRALPVALLLAVLLALPARTRAKPPPEEPRVEKVRKAIEHGKDYLVRRQSRAGDWEGDVPASRPGGGTALALLALLNAGVPAEDPVIQNGLKWLRTVPAAQTYVVGLQTMVYCLAGQNEDRERIQRNVDWLVKARQMNGDKLRGWSYTQGQASVPDNSNMQYALLGLHEAQAAGFAVDPEVWRSVRTYYIDYQSRGGWAYKRTETAPTLTMTTAGLCGLVIAGMDLNQGRETLRDGRWDKCGDYEENRAVAQALEWMGTHFPAGDDLRALSQHLFYALYGVERAGRLTGLRFFGPHDWYRAGCDFLTERQNPDGSWRGLGDESWPIVATSFSLLFLSKGRTPVLVSKLVHDGRDGGRIYRDDWNNDRNDARHLVEFSSRELFKRQPMGWQVFNSRDVEPASVESLVAELLQAPVAYLNGHYAPDFAREGRMKEVLKKYVENGGFILAEACCSRPEFDGGFRELMKELFPDTPLTKLGDDHAVWTASGKFAIPPNRRPPLEGIQMGCKTVVVYSPKDLSCWWESNQYGDGEGQTAFRLGANIIAYATGLEPPKPRLTEVEVFRDDPRETKVPRGYVKVAQLKHEGDWQPAPRAMPNLMRELREKSRLDVATQVEEINPRLPEVIDFKFLYMHGRRSFRIAPEKLEHLRFNLETGGLLFADACCGSDEFAASFRQLIDDLWAGKKLQKIPLTDELFGKELNGTVITEVRCRRKEAGRADREFQPGEPLLEGLKVNGRWAVIFSKYDIGCALEKTKSTSCFGHDYESAVRLGTAAVLYALKR